jgi:hypothetical protein
MAVTQSSVTANLGNGVVATRVMMAVSMAPSISQKLARPIPRPRGAAGATFVTLTAFISAAAFAEASAAATPTTLPTVNQTSINPAGYIASMGPTDEARLRATEENDPVEIMKELILYALGKYLGTDSSVGISGYQFTQVSAVGGNTGGVLTRSSVIAARLTVQQAVKNASAHVFVVIEAKGWNDLQSEQNSSSAAGWANAATEDWVRAFMAKGGIPASSIGYRASIDEYTHIIVEPDSGNLATVGGDKVGCVFIAFLPRLEEVTTPDEYQTNLQPAFGIAYDDEPALASIESMYDQEETYPLDAGNAVVAVRAYAGQRQAVWDGFGSAATGITNQNAACQVLYSAT